MVVCAHCFNYLESREGRMVHKHVESMEEILENLKEADEDTKQKIIVNADEEIVRISTGAHSFYWYIGKTKRPKKQQVYHNKWQFVSENYKGFDVEKSKERTKQWNAIPNIKALKCKIGYKDFWYELLNENNLSIYVD